MLSQRFQFNTLIDQLGGRRDLSAKKIRMVTEDIFRKDPVRLIRAYRLAAAFDFEIDADTQATIARKADLIYKSAGERIREELFKILQFAFNVVSYERRPPAKGQPV